MMKFKNAKQENRFLGTVAVWMAVGGAAAASTALLMYPQQPLHPLIPILAAIYAGGLYATERWSEQSRSVGTYAPRIDARFYVLLALLAATFMVFPAVFSVLRAKAQRRRARNAAPWEDEQGR